MFRFTKKPSSGSHSQYLAKITCLVQCGYRRRTDASQVILCSRNTDNVCTTSISTLKQAYNFSYVPAVAPDDDFFVNRNMLEQPP
jgi:hypothetical protein